MRTLSASVILSALLTLPAHAVTGIVQYGPTLGSVDNHRAAMIVAQRCQFAA